MSALLALWRAMPLSEKLGGLAFALLFWPLLALIMAALPN